MKRICIHCAVEFEEYKKGSNVCRVCRNEQQRKWTQKRKEEKERSAVIDADKLPIGRRPYPLKPMQARLAFKKRQTLLKKMTHREEWVEYFRQRLDEVEKDKALMSWIFFGRNKTTDKIILGEEEDNNKRVGRPLNDESKRYKSNEEIWDEIERGVEDITIYKL